MSLSSIRSWFAKGNRAQWCVFGLLALMLFVKCVLFHWFACHSILISSIWKKPFVAAAFYLPKIAISCFYASLIFLLKDKRWIILLSFLIDVWLLANLVYIRTNNLYLDVYALSMAGNMSGFWNSVLIFIEWKDIIFFILSALISIIIWLLNSKKRNVLLWGVLLMFSVVFHYLGEWCHNKSQDYPFIILNTISRKGRSTIYGVDFKSNVELTSILYSPFYIFSDFIQINKDRNCTNIMTDQDIKKCDTFINHTHPNVKVDGLIIIIVESLEDWVVRPEIMPNLWKITQFNHIFYASRIKTQTISAESADGQMIINTGLLPISEGATCYRFPFVTFPGIMHNVTSNAITILPHQTDVWNQTMMSPAYGYDTTIVCSDVDTILFHKLNEIIDSGIRNIQCITMSTHSPFSGCKYSSLTTPKDMPNVMSDYIRAFNALDYGMSQFINRIENDTSLATYTIIITGDHRIFHTEKRDLFIEYTKKSNQNYSVQYESTPLIIYSPSIEGNIQITDTCYQMDIYPTIMHLIGCEDYYWKGFGVNLLDSVARHNRPISEQEAYRLSDLMIRSDYFRQYLGK
ncbi:MAG: sulfatase-like hydrolase/transferase [Paludibacteraceae bacterium]|nr:sulfatase-like hydrolase/transferase [Paludibacteraceae bacterium]